MIFVLCELIKRFENVCLYVCMFAFKKVPAYLSIHKSGQRSE